MALEIQLERMHVTEAINARDAVVQRLADAYISINQKNTTIEDLRREKGALSPVLTSSSDTKVGNSEDVEKWKLIEHVAILEGVVKGLQDDLKHFKSIESGRVKSPRDPPPHYEEYRTPPFKVH
jgi:hypothetical protein